MPFPLTSKVLGICYTDARTSFLLWTTGGALIWNIILAYAGFVLGKNFSAIDKYIGPAATICVVGAVILYLWRLATWKPKVPVGEDR